VLAGFELAGAGDAMKSKSCCGVEASIERSRASWAKTLVAKRLHQKKRKVKKLTLSVF
jgi:hypothetical protein